MHLPIRFSGFLTAALFSAAASLYAVPVVSIISPAPGSAISSLTSVSITFSEPVTGVAGSDLGLNGEPLVTVTGTGAGPYVFSFPQPPAGPVSFGWDADQAIAGLGTGALVTPGGWSYTLTDTLPPAIAKISSSVAGQEMDSALPVAGSTVGSLTGAVVTFNEPVTGVTAGDLLVNGVPATAVTGDSAGPYSFSFVQPSDGAVNFTWAAGHGIADTAANAFAGTGWSVTKAPGAGSVVISEFLVNNGGTAVAAGSDTDGTRDENWDLSAWIELHNTGAAPVNLLGWSLTDDTAEPAKWVFPARTLAAGARILVFASGKDRKPASGNLHTNFGLSDNGGTLALYAPDAPMPAAASAWLNYPAQRYDYSYGTQSTDGAVRYFNPPTVSQGAYTLPSSDIGGTTGTEPPSPAGVENGTSTLTGLTPEPTASVSRGYFNEPFQVVLSCADFSAAIRYTLDGSPPTAASALYSSPLTINGTSVLRVTAFGTGKVPSRAVTNTYLFPGQVVNQPSPPYDNPASTTDNSNPQPPAPGGSPLPIAWGVSSTFISSQTLTGFPTGTATGANNLTAGQIPADYGMDPKVWADPTKYNDEGAVDNVNGVTNRQRIERALRTLPALSLVIRSSDMFGTYPNGQSTAATAGNPAAPLYPNSHSSVKTDMTKACSLELMQPDGETVFVTDCGIDLHGNASRDPFKNPKHGFTIRFKGKYGAGKVEGNIFPDSPVREWDKLILRGDFGGSWMHQSGADTLTAGNDGSQRPRGIRIREAFCKESFRDMGRIGSHHRFVNLFINGVCWGSYELMEDQAEDFSASYLGGNKDDHDVVDQGKLKSGTWSVWSAMKLLIGWTNVTDATNKANTTTVPSNYLAAFTNQQYETLRTYLDMPWFQDYMIWQTFSGHRDWATDASDAGKYMKNAYFIRPKNGTYKVMPWDMENLLWHQDEDRISAMTTFTSAPTLFPPAVIHPRVKTNAEYRLEFADRAWRHLLKPGGALTPQENIARLDKWAAVCGPDAIALESARWGDYRFKVHAYTSGTVTQVYTWNGAWYDNNSTAQYNGAWAAGISRFNSGRTLASQLGTYSTSMANAWYDEIRRLKTVYFPVRSSTVMNQYRTNGLYPFLNTPELRGNADNALLGDSQVAPGTQVKLVMPAAGTGSSTGDIFFTTDGTDPRPQYDQSGTPRAGASLYTTPISINGPTVIKARARGTTAGFPRKSPVRAATTATAGTYNATGGASTRGQLTAAPLILDGVTLSPGDRVLVKNHTTASANGIYTVTAPGAGSTGVWDRADDWDANGEVTANTWTTVTSGTTNSGSIWRVSTTGTITVGGASGTAISFATQQFSVWSALMEITLNVGPAQPTVVISEIHYNPPGSQGGTAAEFVEFYNYGTLPVDMTSWSMDGISFIFPGSFMLQPGQRAVIASNNNPVMFAAQYPGVVVLGYYSGTLDNGGERLSLLNAAGKVVHSVEYDDANPWPAAADNGGYSMELINPSGDAQSFANWQASSVIKGTPGAANSTPSSAIVISEFFAAGGQGYVAPGFTPQPDFVELHNTGSSSVDVGLWALNETAFPPSVIIPGGGRLIVTATTEGVSSINLGHPLDRTQGEIVLRNQFGQVVDGVRYGPQITDHSFYRSGSTWTLGLPTPGAPSTPALTIGAERLVLNEIMANPLPGEDDWLELYCDDGDDPCVITGLTFEINGSLFTVSAPSVIQGDTWLRLWCSPGGQRGDNLNLSLPSAGAVITIRDAAWNPATTLTYGAQQQGVSRGILGSLPGLQTLTYPSPGDDNFLLPPNRPQLNEVLVLNENGDNAPWARRSPWVELRNPSATAADITGWSLRTIGSAPARWTLPAQSLSAGGLLAIWCDDAAPASNTAGLHQNAALPISNVFYSGFNANTWGLELLDAAGAIMDRVTWGHQIPDHSIGCTGGGTWELLATPTRGTANSAAAALAPASGVKINEWLALPGSANYQNFLELYNPAAQPVALGGLWLGDAPSETGRRKWQLPALSFLAPSGFNAYYNESEGSTHPAYVNFNIASGGEYLRLSSDDAAATALDSVSFGTAIAVTNSQGRLTDGSASIGSLSATPGLSNTAANLPSLTQVPFSRAASAGQTITLHASGSTAGVTVQWMKNGVPIPGANDFTLTLGPLTAADEAGYTISLTNGAGTTTSPPAHLTVLYNWDAYAAQYGLVSQSGDNDGDGISNGSEFLAGTDPLNHTPMQSAVTGGYESVAGIDYLTLEYSLSRRAAYHSIDGQRSTDLSVWNTDEAAVTEILATQTNGDQRVKIKFPWLPEEDRAFVRLLTTP